MLQAAEWLRAKTGWHPEGCVRSMSCAARQDREEQEADQKEEADERHGETLARNDELELRLGPGAGIIGSH